MMTRGIGLGAALLALAVAATPAAADTVTLEPVKDNTMFEESGAASNGAGAHLFTGTTGQSDRRRALLAFDLAGAVPPGATVTAASLRVTCTRSPIGNPPGVPVSIHRVLADWGEAGSDAGDPGGLGAPAQAGDATWTERFFDQGMAWATPGGDRVGELSSTIAIDDCPSAGIARTFVSSDLMVADVQGWVDDPSSNFGWLILSFEEEDFTARRWASRENPNPDLRPQLTVEFETVDVPATSPWGLALLAGAILALATVIVQRRRASRGGEF